MRWVLTAEEISAHKEMQVDWCGGSQILHVVGGWVVQEVGLEMWLDCWAGLDQEGLPCSRRQRGSREGF